MPEGFPDRLKADKPEDFVAKLQEDWKQQHQKLSGLPQPAKAIEEYAFKPSDKVAPFVGDLAKDPVFSVAQKAALAAGLPVDAFQKFVGKFYDDMADGGLLTKPLDVKAEALKFLGKTDAQVDEETALKELAPIAEPLFGLIDKVCADHKLSPEAKAAAYALMDTADGMTFVKALVDAAKTPGIQPGGQGGGANGVTRAQLIERQQDPRNKFGSSQWDPAFKAETDRLYKEFSGK
jgi:hypothetical protein